MPFYRIAGTMVHLKLAGKASKNPPAPCSARLTTSNPVVPAQRCCGISLYLCDWVLPSGKTCDAPLCTEHAITTGPDKHLCPRHAKEVGMA